MRLLKVFPLCLLFVGLLFYGCQRQGECVYHQFRAIGQGCWDYQDTVVFDIDTLRQGRYDVDLMLRTNKRTTLRSLYVAVEQDFGVVCKDTIQIFLADTLGKSSGQGLSLKQYSFSLDRPIELRSSCRGTVRIYHLMRRSYIEGVEDVGIRICK